MPLTVHHLHCSQSERIPWLCEELNIPYELKTYKRSPMLAPPEYKALHPSGSAPIIQDTLPTNDSGNDVENPRTLTLAESGACVQYICEKHGNGKFLLPPSHKDYANFVYWFHWANGTFQPLMSRFMALKGVPGGGGQSQNPSANPSPMAAVLNDRLQRSLGALDKRFKTKEEGGDGATWLAGDEFTAADIMVVFSLTTFRYWFGYSLREYAGILGYLGRVGERDGYKMAMAKADPEMKLLLGAEAPSA